MKNTEKFWSRIASKSGATLSVNDKRLLELMQPHLSDEKSLLDIGCGPGQISIELAKALKHVTGLDTSIGVLDIAKQLATENNIANISFIETALGRSDFEPESFDLITAFNMLHYLPEPALFLNQVYDLLKPKGLFISSTACFQEGGGLITNFMKWGAKLSLIPKAELYSFSALEALIINGGFSISEKQILSNIQEYYLVGIKH